MPDIFDEVNEELRAERAQRLLQRYGVLLIAAAILVVVAVGGWQFWRYRQQQAREAVAATFLQAMNEASGPAGAKTPDRAKAEATFAKLATDAPQGYRTLARLREAALKADDGDLKAALALWDQVSSDENADPTLRRVADLLWVQHQVDSGDPTAVEARLVPLIAPTSPWRPLGLEAEAWLKLRTGDKAEAAKMLREIIALPNATSGVRSRAAILLQRLGENPSALIPGAEKQG